MRIRPGSGILLLTVLSLIIYGCASLEGVLNLSRPTAKIEQVEMTGLTFERVDLLLYVRIENPNPVGARLAGLDYDLRIEDASIVKGNLEKGIELKSGGSSLVEVPVSVGFSEIFTTVEAAAARDKLDYGINLGLAVALPGYGTIRIPLEHRGTLPVPRLPELRIESLRVTRVTLTRIDLEVNMKVANPNSFDLRLSGFSYDLSVAGRSWVEGREVPALAFGAGQESVATLPLSLNIVEVGRSVVDTLSGNRSLDYRFSGQTTIDTGLPLLEDYLFSFDSGGEARIFR